MASTYPNQLDIFPGAPYVDGTEFILAAYANFWVSCITALETTIGVGTGSTATNPLYSQASGTTYPTVTARIAAIETSAAGGLTLNHSSGNIQPVAPSNGAGTVGSAADAGHQHEGVSAFTSGYGLSTQSTDGSGHGAVNASVALAYSSSTTGTLTTTATQVGVATSCLTTKTLNPGTWQVTFMGFGVGDGTASPYYVGVFSVQGSTGSVVNFDSGFLCTPIILGGSGPPSPFNETAIITFSQAGTATLVGAAAISGEQIQVSLGYVAVRLA